jgi:hypothetical protein
MRLRASILFFLFISLLLSPLRQHWLPHAPSATMSGCAMTVCTDGCCVKIPCCSTKSTGEKPHPAPARIPNQTEQQLAIADLHLLPFLYSLPAPERSIVIRDEVRAGHALPPLAASCIQLI